MSNQDRILLNGVWYVRESISTDTSIEIEEKDLTKTASIVYEPFGGDYAWEAIKIYHTEDTFYNGLDIKFTDKRSKPWKEEHWDNDAWMLQLVDNDKDALEIAKESMSADGIRTFQAFLKVLITKEWL